MSKFDQRSRVTSAKVFNQVPRPYTTNMSENGGYEMRQPASSLWRNSAQSQSEFGTNNPHPLIAKTLGHSKIDTAKIYLNSVKSHDVEKHFGGHIIHEKLGVYKPSMRIS